MPFHFMRQAPEPVCLDACVAVATLAEANEALALQMMEPPLLLVDRLAASIKASPPSIGGSLECMGGCLEYLRGSLECLRGCLRCVKGSLECFKWGL